MRSQLARRVLFFGGKGGVGKTTCSAAAALAASREGRRVLLVSTDPAHSLCDVLGFRTGSDEREVMPRLRVLEIDAETEARRYLEQAKAQLAAVFGPAVLREAIRQIELTAAMPGVADVASFDRISDILLSQRSDVDLIIFDTAPTGHTLRLLAMPESMAVWVRALAERRRAASEASAALPQAGPRQPAAADPVLSVLDRRAARLDAVRQLLTSSDTCVVLVLVPERLPIEETGRAMRLLDESGIQVGGLVVNRVLPQGLEGEYYRSRKAQEDLYLREIERRFDGVRRVLLPQLEADVRGVRELEQVAAFLLDGGSRRGAGPGPGSGSRAGV